MKAAEAELFEQPGTLQFDSRFTGSDQLCLRRCQANLLYKDDYIGVHKDQDSNPDYYATVVFHFGSAYRGGAFVTHDKHQGGRHYSPPVRLALVNNCSIPHEVTAVEAGERLTLACFLSREFGPSGEQRQQFKMMKNCS